MLNFETFGDEQQPTLVIAHGLFGSARNWRVISKKLSDQFRIIAVDMRNHAGSFWSDEMSYAAMATDLAAVIDQTDGPAMVLGHSMGGKAAMVLALTRPELVERLVIADIAPVGYTHSHAHFIDAMEAVDLTKVTKRSDVGDQLAKRIDDPGLRAFLMQSVSIEDGAARWLLNLSVLKSAMPSLVGWPDMAESFEGPTLFVAGANSDYIDNEGRVAIKPLFPDARVLKLKGAGHWLHADQPKAFIETVRAFCVA